MRLKWIAADYCSCGNGTTCSPTHELTSGGRATPNAQHALIKPALGRMGGRRFAQIHPHRKMVW